MQWQRLKPPEPDDPLCCCECDSCRCRCCCDCEGVDEAFARWLKGRPPPSGSCSAVLESVIDRLEISMIPVLLLLPLLLRVAALHYLLGAAILTALPGLVLWYYYATHRKKRRTLFFLGLSLYSLFYMYYLFVTEILPRGDVGHLQLCAVTCGMLLTVALLVVTKRGPGFVGPADSLREARDAGRDGARRGAAVQSAASSTAPIGRAGEEPQSARWNKCALCKTTRPPRAGHCRTCERCVYRLDHHCIWINSCVGQANHRSFVATLAVFVLTSLYGIGLVLGSLCPRQRLATALFHCPAVYSRPSTALCFTCAWFSSIVTAGLLYLLTAQLLNISFNVTERESLLALRNKTGRSRLRGLVVDTGEYSRGFYKNWVEFLTMADALASPQPGLTDLV